jgi:hypothetical protein
VPDGIREEARDGEIKLQRSLGLWLSVLYGLGVTIGAGIYVLIAPVVARAGTHTPLAFFLAALVRAPSAASFAELASRMRQGKHAHSVHRDGNSGGCGADARLGLSHRGVG